MVCRAPGHLRLRALKAKRLQIQLIDEDINDADGVILSNVVVEMLWKQCALRTILAFDKSLHHSLPLPRREMFYATKNIGVFTHPRPEGATHQRQLSGPPVHLQAAPNHTRRLNWRQVEAGAIKFMQDRN